MLHCLCPRERSVAKAELHFHPSLTHQKYETSGFKAHVNFFVTLLTRPVIRIKAAAHNARMADEGLENGGNG